MLNLTMTTPAVVAMSRPYPDAYLVHNYRRGLNMIARNGALRFASPVRGCLAGIETALGRVTIRDGAGALIDLHLG